MLSSNSLEPPKSGRSRFSKALPAVPGLATNNSLPPLPLETPRRDLSVPARNDATGRAQETPFSPLSAIASPTSSASTPTSIKSKMTIPRRPVGAGSGTKAPGLPVSPAPARSLAPVPAAMKTLEPPATSATNASTTYVPPPSPSDSLSSLLSAYSRSSIGSPVMSSEGTASVRDSQQTSSPSQIDRSPGATAPLAASSTPITSVTFTPVPPPKESSITSQPAQYQASDLRPKPFVSPVPVRTAAPPAPAKDVTSTQQLSSAASQTQTHNPDLSAPSPPRPQIWRRRSINKSKDLPPLTIHSSHGSTASTAPQAPPKPDLETASILTQSTTETIKPLPPLSTTKPHPPVIGLPGRNVRPAQSNQVDIGAKGGIGGESSKLKRLSDKLHLSGNSANIESTVKAEASAPVNAGRPPTPEYQKEDVKTPMLATFVSPVSPASSPEPGKNAPPPVSKEPSPSFMDETPKPKPLPMIDAGSISRKAVAPAAVPDLYSPRSVPDLRSAAPSPPTAPVPSLPTTTPSFTANRERRPSDAASIRGRESAGTARFPPRGSSVKPEGRQMIVSSQSLPHTGSPENDPRLVRSNSGNMMYRGRDGTLYPEMKDPGTPDPKASYFPKHPQGPIPDGTILPAPPLRNSHYFCYQKHRNMGRRVNRQYPLTCQTCDKADVEDRWVCTFCQLRMCTSCHERFTAKGRDLKHFMESVKSPELPEVLTLSSGERPGSALGLQINF